GRSKQRRAEGIERTLADRGAHPFVVGAIFQYEFDLVARREVIEVRPAVSMTLARSGCLQIHDLSDARIHARDVGFTARLDEYGSACVTELGEEDEGAGREERLAPRELDELGLECERALLPLGARHSLAAVKCLRRVAPCAPQIAPRETHEGARHA